MKNLYKIQDELYIVSNKEKSSYCIKECPMAGLNIDRCDCQIFTACSNKVGNIILTTNNLLIKDGVQAIPDEFLEWFVKNPSCEFVKTTNYFEYFGEDESISYKIIIPKEEQTVQVIEMFDEIDGSKTFMIKEDLEKIIEKQETLEEAFDRIFDSIDYTEFDFTSFEQGAKWQAERSYSEEEVRGLLIKFHNEFPDRWDIDNWFEQFKKK